MHPGTGSFASQLIATSVVLADLCLGSPGPSDVDPNVIGRWADGPVQVAALSGARAYHGQGGYLIVRDVSDPSAPVELGRTVLPGFVVGMDVVGDLVYVANEYGGQRDADLRCRRGG